MNDTDADVLERHARLVDLAGLEGTAEERANAIEAEFGGAPLQSRRQVRRAQWRRDRGRAAGVSRTTEWRWMTGRTKPKGAPGRETDSLKQSCGLSQSVAVR